MELSNKQTKRIMKKLILLLLFIPLVSFGQEYSLGKKINLNFESVDIISLKNPDGWRMSKEKTELSNLGNTHQTVVFTKDLSTKISINLRLITKKRKIFMDTAEMSQDDRLQSLFFLSSQEEFKNPSYADIQVESPIGLEKIGDKSIATYSLILNRVYISHRFKFMNDDKVLTVIGEGLKSESEKLKSFLKKLIGSIEIK